MEIALKKRSVSADAIRIGRSSGGNEKEKSLEYSDWNMRRARKDLASMMVRGNIGKPRKARIGIQDGVLRLTVRYILQSNNVQYMALGTRRTTVNGMKLRFPNLVRKVSSKTMWRNYVQDTAMIPDFMQKVKKPVSWRSSAN